MDPTLITIGGFALGGFFLFSMVTFLSRYRKVGPNEALIVSGRGSRGRGFRIVRGGGTFVVPMLEKADVLSLEVMTIDVHTPDVYTMQGVTVEVDGVAQLKVDSNDEATVATAAEQFLGRGRNDIMNVAKQTVEGHLRAILGTMEVEEIYKDREKFAQNVQHVAATDLKNMGLKIVSFTLRDIKDANGYLDSLGKPRLAEVKRDASVRETRMLAEAQIAQSEANRNAAIAQSQAKRDADIETANNAKSGEVARLKAAEETAAAARDLEMKKAEYQANVNQKKADADLAYDLQRFKTQQLVKREEVSVSVVEKEQQIAVQEKEIARRAKELEATVNKPAEAKRYAQQQDAEAQKYAAVAEAQGRAEAQKAEGLAAADVISAKAKAEAEAIRLKGLAEAESIKAKGLAEAEAMKKKAESYSQYNAAAVTEMFVGVLPQIASALATPLSKVDKITVVSTGSSEGGSGTGASKITQDIAQIMAQLPPVVESISGVSLADLVKRVPGLGGGAPASSSTVPAEVVPPKK
ncbi:MAG: flotillin family protein [Deltaproteobacteria bacterium]|nr:flotillin family protein [Deltaproteobacteria bacterium]